MLRVFSRLYNDPGVITDPKVKKAFTARVMEHQPPEKAGDYNQALMELGALVCVPNGAPLCDVCPLAGLCQARAAGTTAVLPQKAKPKPRKVLPVTVALVESPAGFLVQQRPAKGLLAGLWQPLLWESEHLLQAEVLASTLYGTQPGEEWKDEEIKKLKSQVETAGLHLSGIESVNIADEIKTGDSTRDLYIERYIRTLEKLGQNDIHMVCYNFMPVFDWTRSDLAKPRPDGSNVLAYDQKQIDQIDPQKMFESMDAKSNGFIMPGWEPERLEKVKELFEKYAEIDEETLFENLVYFLNAIMPVCDKYDINMAIHPDDPAWPGSYS